MMGSRGILGHRKGFTLAELVMAIAVLSIAGVFLVQVFLSADRLATKASDLDRAVAACTTAVETWKAEADPSGTSGIPVLKGARIVKDAEGGATATTFLDDRMEPAAEAAASFRLVLRIVPDGTLDRLTISISYKDQTEALYSIDAARWSGPTGVSG